MTLPSTHTKKSVEQLWNFVVKTDIMWNYSFLESISWSKLKTYIYPGDSFIRVPILHLCWLTQFLRLTEARDSRLRLLAEEHSLRQLERMHRSPSAASLVTRLLHRPLSNGSSFYIVSRTTWLTWNGPFTSIYIFEKTTSKHFDLSRFVDKEVRNPSSGCLVPR